MTGRDLGQCAGHEPSRIKPHPAKPDEFGHSDSRCRVCENARKQLSGIKRRAEMRAGTRPTPPPKPKPEPLKPRTPTKVAPQLPFATVDELIALNARTTAKPGTLRFLLSNREWECVKRWR